MKKLLSLVIIIFAYTQSFAYSVLQISNDVSMGNDAPPPPTISPYGSGIPEQPDPPSQTPIDFIVPLLLISVIILTVYFIRKNEKNKLKSI